MKTLNTEEMVQSAMNEIKKIAPKNSQIEIDVREDPVGTFSTHILLKTKQHVYFAKKDDLFLYRSFNKALRAIKAQLQKKRYSYEGRIDKYGRVA